MNAIIYIRVSTTEQAELGYSLKAQEEICLEFAKRYKYEVLKVFIEKGESAKTLNRAQLKSLLEYARINKWNHGFAGLEFDGNDFEIENKRIVKGAVR